MFKTSVIFGCLTVFVILGAVVWQTSVKQSKEDEAENHRAVAQLIESAQADGMTAGELLTQYVATGDETLLPQIQEHTDAGVRQLTNAINQAGGDPNRFVEQGSALVQSAGQVIALRQAGDAAAATERLTSVGGEFQAFMAAQTEFVEAERAKAVDADAAAEDAGTAAGWLAVGAVTIMLALAAATGVAVVSRRRSRRSATEALAG